MTMTKREGRGRIGANHRVRGDRSPQVSTADPRGVWRVPRDSRAHDHHCPKPPRPLKILPAEVEKRTAKKSVMPSQTVETCGRTVSARPVRPMTASALTVVATARYLYDRPAPRRTASHSALGATSGVQMAAQPG